MVNINETPAWEETIKLIERLERVAGGRDGAVNIQARQLANRTLFLYRELMSLQLVAYDAAAVFADTAAGLLATSPGEYFKTPGDGQSLLIWQNNNGQALKVAELAGPESIKAIQASVARIAAINASSIDKLPGVSGLGMDATGKVVFQQLDDGASQFPALMIGDDIEAVQSQSGMILRSRASGQEFIHIKRNSLITPGQELFLGEHGVAEAQADRQGRTFSETAADGTRLFAAISIGGIDIVQSGKGLSLIRRQDGQEISQIRHDGSIVQNGVYTFYTDKYPGYSEIELDRQGRVFRQRRTDGTLEEASQQSNTDTVTPPFAYADGGSIYAINGGSVTRLTDDPEGVENTEPASFPTFIRWLSARDGVRRVHRGSFDGKRRVRESSGSLVHIIGTGQSLAPGGSTKAQAPVTTAAQADYGIIAFASGPKVDYRYDTLDSELLTSVIPCRENTGIRPGQESPASGMAWQVHQMTRNTVLVSTAASSGTAIDDISAGTPTFTGATAMIEAGAALAAEMGMEYVPVLVLVHGNQNAALGTAADTYRQAMERLRKQYESVVNSVTGREDSLMMFAGQLANVIPYGGNAGDTKTNAIGIAQYRESRDNPFITLASTQYARAYSDGEHLTSNSYRTEGEVIGAAIGTWLNDGEWSPLTPDESGIVQTNSTITIPVKGCTGGLVADTVRVADPGHYGFTLAGAEIAAVAVEGSDASAKIIITKTSNAMATAVSYATTGTAGKNPGAQTGSRGCIRDSRPGVSLSGDPLFNDLVVFTHTF
ncbi:hypothetical protein [Klebsiella pneumoniae]|uniref:hypothetical protein n=1 Tax=Klebsiella pneumoniae TaxID=573 RepID=UPI00108339FD|nr:hypothetical protein [Klebsiella pneumoniae]MDK7807419.1 hypothetical protein [Klebsiella pneumoniae]VGE25019.1 putative prophage endo-N-neuraminidase [Klebsiella pneumoniae]VGE48548.1 putative prophage endo-N-neuraminidase [Klebsiella pneumoniae]HBS5622848.1 hypothetical protein [Klebsiella pneumoniae]HDN2554757.1 hypothetical protein [Klebsiella pneumoniae]